MCSPSNVTEDTCCPICQKRENVKVALLATPTVECYHSCRISFSSKLNFSDFLSYLFHIVPSAISLSHFLTFLAARTVHARTHSNTYVIESKKCRLNINGSLEQSQYTHFASFPSNVCPYVSVLKFIAKAFSFTVFTVHCVLSLAPNIIIHSYFVFCGL